jgi:spore germination protein GerM
MRQRAHGPAALVRVLLFAAALNTVLAACTTVNPSGGPSGAPSSPGGVQPSSRPTEGGSTSQPTAAPGTYRVYFGLGSTAGNPVLAPVERSGGSPQATDGGMRAAVEALLAGPNQAELAGSPAMFTAIPTGTTVTALQVSGAGVATVDLSGGFEETDELPALRTALAQVVFTLTQFPNVTGVNVTIGGAVLTQTDANGKDLAGPATRADYGDQMGPLFVDSPTWGATLRSPMHLAGLADVFEATFRFRLLDADGRSLADRQLQASCGTGCLGTFAFEVPFNVAASTAGRLQVFDLSELDGSMADVVDYPVTLLP